MQSIILYKSLSEIEKSNPCRFIPGEGCIAYRLGDTTVKKIGCCLDGCISLGDTGCGSQNLACKSFLCDVALQNLTPKKRTQHAEFLSQVRNLYPNPKAYWDAMGDFNKIAES